MWPLKAIAPPLQKIRTRLKNEARYLICCVKHGRESGMDVSPGKCVQKWQVIPLPMGLTLFPEIVGTLQPVRFQRATGEICRPLLELAVSDSN